MTESYFLKMIQQLRQHEQVVLYERVLSTSEEEESLVVDYLREEYEKEFLHYPDGSPAYHAPAALWGAKTVYITAQLILYRENHPDELSALIPDYEDDMDTASVVSADLCLRFLPEMIRHLSVIDSEDKLIALLSSLLQRWHYSGIEAHVLDWGNADFKLITDSKALHQLYCERIIHHRNMTLAAQPAFNEAIGAQLGLYGQELWRDFKRTLS